MEKLARPKEDYCLMSSRLDKFYTKRDVVSRLLSSFNYGSYDVIVEPSAGAGDFLSELKHDNIIAMDIQPDSDKIKKMNFFDFIYTAKKDEMVLTIGNPPFGKNSSLAVKFFNHAAEFSDCIAFIVPRTFRKPSIINRLDSNFHLTSQKILEKSSFYLPSGEDYKVPTVFQVWERSTEQRAKIITLKEHPDFEFVPINHSPSKSPTDEQKIFQCNEADFCVRRVGAAAGKVYKDYGTKYRDWKSHYYIKEKFLGAREIIESINWEFEESPKFDNAGNPSISKNDLIKFYIENKTCANSKNRLS